MVGGGRRGGAAEEVKLNTGNVFAALESLKKKKKGDKGKAAGRRTARGPRNPRQTGERVRRLRGVHLRHLARGRPEDHAHPRRRDGGGAQGRRRWWLQEGGFQHRAVGIERPAAAHVFVFVAGGTRQSRRVRPLLLLHEEVAGGPGHLHLPVKRLVVGCRGEKAFCSDECRNRNLGMDLPVLATLARTPARSQARAGKVEAEPPPRRSPAFYSSVFAQIEEIGWKQLVSATGDGVSCLTFHVVNGFIEEAEEEELMILDSARNL
uniref:FLZ-type domain-containing protein n=1 Tax=Zea mays TaxID=4577 RepID=A0A804NN24_MAIZE